MSGEQAAEGCRSGLSLSLGFVRRVAPESSQELDLLGLFPEARADEEPLRDEVEAHAVHDRGKQRVRICWLRKEQVAAGRPTSERREDGEELDEGLALAHRPILSWSQATNNRPICRALSGSDGSLKGG